MIPVPRSTPRFSQTAEEKKKKKNPNNFTKNKVKEKKLFAPNYVLLLLRPSSQQHQSA